MLAQIFLIFGLASIGLGLYLLKINKRQPEKYLWVGHGDDPFKN